MKSIVAVLIFFTSLIVVSQEKYPENYFQHPLNIPLILSGSFGELRSNHFHAGLDIKTQGKEGLEVFSSADGYVSRIKVSQFGYGKALYITHPNGFTTVYAHLSKFNDRIEQFVKSIQYQKESYETGDLYLKNDQFPIKKGEMIAFSGDTGGSGGPHLHFEIRDTESENVINPLLFGIRIQDSIPPTFQSVKAYALADDARINNQRNSFQIPIKKIKKGTYVADKISASSLIGFGVDVIDKANNAYNKNGIYSLEMLVNGAPYYYHDVETFSFAESKYINLHIDYEHFKNYKDRYQKTYIETNNYLSTYKDVINNGKIQIQNNFSYNVTIIAKDFFGNESSVSIPVISKESNAIFSKQNDSTAFRVIANNFTKFSQENVTIAFPKNTFYEDVYLDFKVENKIAKIHTPTIPLDKNFTLTFNVSNYSKEEKEQLYIANLEYPKYPRYVETRKRDSTFFTTTKTLGNYTLLSDNQKPTIKLLYIKDGQWITNSNTLKVRIDDVGSGIDSYRATIDDEWILMEYNHKKGILTYNFNDKKLVGSKHIFKIVVSDNVGNTNELSATFYKKQVN